MLNSISFIIGLKNNLDYTKYFYTNTRTIYPEIEIVFVSYGSTDGTHQWLESLKDDNLIFFYSLESKTLSDTYNKGIKLSTKEYVCFLHIILITNIILDFKTGKRRKREKEKTRMVYNYDN